MKIFCISDTHARHNELVIPDCDMIIHAGDGSNKPNPYLNEREEIEFLDWFAGLNIEYKIMVAGNHDTAIFKKLVNPRDWEVMYLEHEAITIEGLNIFGSPYTPQFGNWAFMYKRNRGQVVWDCIPDNTEILITHGGPKGILDLANDVDDRKKIVQVGCKSLLNRVEEVKPKIHVFGHIHNQLTYNNRGIYDNGITKFVNAACLNHDGTIYPGLEIEL